MKKALEILKSVAYEFNEYGCVEWGYSQEYVNSLNESIAELKELNSCLKDLFSCIELSEDENAEKRLSSMEPYLMRLASYLK